MSIATHTQCKQESVERNVHVWMAAILIINDEPIFLFCNKSHFIECYTPRQWARLWRYYFIVKSIRWPPFVIIVVWDFPILICHNKKWFLCLDLCTFLIAFFRLPIFICILSVHLSRYFHCLAVCVAAYRAAKP